MIVYYLEYVIEVDRVHHVNHHVRNIVIVHVVHVIEMNIGVVRIMMANIVVIIDDVRNAVFS
jgi:hypothetical protein